MCTRGTIHTKKILYFETRRQPLDWKQCRIGGQPCGRTFAREHEVIWNNNWPKLFTSYFLTIIFKAVNPTPVNMRNCQNIVIHACKIITQKWLRWKIWPANLVLLILVYISTDKVSKQFNSLTSIRSVI